MVRNYLHSLGMKIALFLAVSQWGNGENFPHGKDMKVIYEWHYMDFTWPSEQAREEAIRNGEYIAKNVIPIDITVYNDRIFLTTPGFKPGIPVTLSTISDKMRNGQNLLKPFPDWEQNLGRNCDELISVYRTGVDDFGNLWVLDTGAVYFTTSRNPLRVCQPKLLVYDLNDKDKLVGRYIIPDSVLDCNSLLVGLQVDQRAEHWTDSFVYICDSFGAHIVVLDVRRGTFYRVTHNSFLPNPHEGDYYIAGTRVFNNDAIYSLALGPVCNDDRRLYYHAYGSLQECYVMASTLRDKAFVTNERANQDSFYCFAKNRASQSGPELITSDGIMFFEQDTLNAIACWNTEFDYNMGSTAIVAQNDTTMQSVKNMGLTATKLYALSDRSQLYFFGTISSAEVNYRVLEGSLAQLLRGTPCEKPCPQNRLAYKSRFDQPESWEL